MRVEVEQPDIDRVPLDHPRAWAEYAQVHSKWLRAVALQFGLDVDKLILGDVLSTIIGDDANCFIWYESGAPFESEWAERARNNLLFRLGWEINTPELPDNIREKLREVKEAVELLDWTNEATFKEAMKIWYSAKDWVVEEIDKKPKLREAIEYDSEESQVLSEAYEKFIYGKTVHEMFQEYVQS